MLAGFLARLAVLDIAVAVDFMARQDTVPAEHAPFWFIHALTGRSFGVLSPSEALLIQETYYPHPLVIFALYAICYMAQTCRVSRSADKVNQPVTIGPHSA